MSDDKNKRGEQDRRRIASDENWELRYMMDKFNVSQQKVEEAIKAVGNDRRKVEDYLDRTRVKE
jgi:hypothetical protein